MMIARSRSYAQKGDKGLLTWCSQTDYGFEICDRNYCFCIALNPNGNLVLSILIQSASLAFLQSLLFT